MTTMPTLALDRKPMGEMRLALDRSARSIDPHNGWLRAEACHVTKANVCPYRGKEIPDPDGKLNLDPKKMYYLYRDPDELQAALPSLNTIPIMDGHVVAHAIDHPQLDTVGATASDAAWNDPYVDVSLNIWTDWSIEGIQTRDQCELSCSYHYIADMTPGEHKGLRFDGVMRKIHFNHVALVPEGRAGPDVVVADAKPEDQRVMKNTSKKALMVRGAMVAYARPLVAADVKLSDAAVAALQGVNRTNFRAMKAKIADRFAKDAKLDDEAKAGLKIALDAMEKEDCGEDDEMDDDDKKAKDETPEERHERYEREEGGAAEDDKDDDKAEDETEEERKEREGGEKGGSDKKGAKDRAAKDKVAAKDAETKTVKAMDAAIDAAVRKAVKTATSRIEAVATAKDAVRPYIGDVVGMDSAAAVYEMAFDALEIDYDGVPAAAYPKLLKLAPVPGAQTTTLATDAAMTTDNQSWLKSAIGNA